MWEDIIKSREHDIGIWKKSNAIRILCENWPNQFTEFGLAVVTMASQLPESALMRVSLSNDYCEIKILVDIGRSSGLNIISKHVQRLNSTLKFFTAIYIYDTYMIWWVCWLSGGRVTWIQHTSSLLTIWSFVSHRCKRCSEQIALESDQSLSSKQLYPEVKV